MPLSLTFGKRIVKDRIVNAKQNHLQYKHSSTVIQSSSFLIKKLKILNANLRKSVTIQEEIELLKLQVDVPDLDPYTY